jgi:cytochrome c biogenesis protein CcmG/thiol:disulfide interchange protein DsbE
VRPRRGRVNGVVLALGLVIVVPLVALLGSGFGNDPRAVPSVLVGKPAPGFTLRDLNGTPVSLEALRGRPVVLNFWSTWCQPCRLEHPLLQDAARAWPDVAFLGVVYNDEAEKCRRYLDKAGSAYPALIDPDGRVAIDYGVAGVPETFIVAPDGTIAHKHVGPLHGAQLRAYLTPLREPG